MRCIVYNKLFPNTVFGGTVMPLLKYRCTACGKRFEELVSLSNEKPIHCPDCGEKAERAYEGKCLFGTPGSGSGCSGNCSGCSGCHHG